MTGVILRFSPIFLVVIVIVTLSMAKTHKQSQSVLPNQLAALQQLYERCLKQTIQMDRAELVSMSTAVLQDIVHTINTTGALLPANAIKHVIYFASQCTPDDQCIVMACKVFASILHKHVFKLYRDDISGLYKRHRQQRHSLFLAVRVSGEEYCGLLLADVEECKRIIKQEAAQLTHTAASNKSRSKPTNIDTVLLECISCLLSSDVELSTSVRLCGALIDVFVMNKQAAVLQAAAQLCLKAPCLHPLFPVVLALLVDNNSNSNRNTVDTSLFDLIVHPRRHPSIVHRHVSVPVGDNSTPDCTTNHQTQSDAQTTMAVQVTEQSDAQAVYQPQVTKKTRYTDLDDLPVFVMDGPDSE